jgi:hypothetical protein
MVFVQLLHETKVGLCDNSPRLDLLNGPRWVPPFEVHQVGTHNADTAAYSLCAVNEYTRVRARGECSVDPVRGVWQVRGDLSEGVVVQWNVVLNDIVRYGSESSHGGHDVSDPVAPEHPRVLSACEI